MTMRTKVVSALAVAAVLTAATAQDQDVQRLSGDQVAIYNLVGNVSVVAGTGSDVVVRIQRGGADASQLRIETGEIRGRTTLRIVYPSDEIVYSRLRGRYDMTTRVRSDGTFGDGGDRGDRVRIRSGGSGLEAWADLVIEMPAGQSLAAYVGVGAMEAEGVDGELSLDIGSGRVSASDVSGALVIDTGSGGVTVAGVRGPLAVDTGSGSVDISDVVGAAVSIDTGSGGVDVRNVEADDVLVDTGSGSVEMVGISAPNVVVDTGSGRVELELLRDVDALVIDTGSGSVTVRAPADLGGMVEIETGSGGIDLDFPLTVNSVRRDRVRGALGDGDGAISIETGSGSVRLLER